MSINSQPPADTPIPSPALQQQDGPPACPQVPIPGVDDSLRVRQLVLSVVRRGLHLDDPWRHAYLRNRWFGA